MGIAAKVVYGITETVKSLFDIGTPVLTVKRIPERYPVGVRSQGSAAVRQDEASRTVEVFKRSHKLALEHGTENPDGDQEIRTGADELHFGSKSCTGYDAVYVGMIVKLLPPGMEHLNDGRCSPEIFLRGRQLQQSSGGGIVQKGVQQLLVGDDQWVKL